MLAQVQFDLFTTGGPTTNLYENLICCLFIHPLLLKRAYGHLWDLQERRDNLSLVIFSLYMYVFGAVSIL